MGFRCLINNSYWNDDIGWWWWWWQQRCSSACFFTPGKMSTWEMDKFSTKIAYSSFSFLLFENSLHCSSLFRTWFPLETPSPTASVSRERNVSSLPNCVWAKEFAPSWLSLVLQTFKVNDLLDLRWLSSLYIIIISDSWLGLQIFTTRAQNIRPTDIWKVLLIGASGWLNLESMRL